MSELLIASTSAVIRHDGRRHVITRNKTILRSDDEVVKGREQLFRPVEQATAEPGEVRTTRRPRKKAPAAKTENTPQPAAATSKADEDSE